MNKNTLLLCFVVFFTASIHSQQQLDCDLNYRIALLHLQGEKLEKSTEKALETLLPCKNSNNDLALALLGRMYMMEKKESSYQKAFPLIRKSAKLGNDIAMMDLATLYKYGHGTNQNLNKSRKWYKKSAELGNAKAQYGLAYLYLKGFGGLFQNYQKAKNNFKKSEYKMAKYWLGYLNYFGYGKERNLQRARTLLGHDIGNEIWNKVNDYNTSSDENIEKAILDNIENTNTKEFSHQELLGKWKGHIISMDWSGKRIHVKEEISLTFQSNSDHKIENVLIDKNGNETQGSVNKSLDYVSFENLNLKIENIALKEEIPHQVSVDLMSGETKEAYVNNRRYLVIALEAESKKWREQLPPYYLILEKVQTFNNSDKEIDDELRNNLNSQNGFVKVFPNPYQGHTVISYSLEESSTVSVLVHDMNGNLVRQLVSNELQEASEYYYSLDTSSLKKGSYIVSILVNGNRQTKITIKN